MGIGRVLSRELFLYALDLEAKRARRSHYPLCVLKLKLSNGRDKENGEGLQDCFESLSNRVSAELREIDIIGRLADDELAVLLPYTDLAGSIRVRSRLEGKLKNFDFKADAYKVKIEQVSFPREGMVTENSVLKGMAAGDAIVL